MTNPKRYQLSVDEPLSPYESPEGEWVRWEDAQAEIEQRDREIRRLRAITDHCPGCKALVSVLGVGPMPPLPTDEELRADESDEEIERLRAALQWIASYPDPVARKESWDKAWHSCVWKAEEALRDPPEPSEPHKLRWLRANYAVTEEQRQHCLNSPLYPMGDCRLVWVNEGDLYVYGQEIESSAPPAGNGPLVTGEPSRPAGGVELDAYRKQVNALALECAQSTRRSVEAIKDEKKS